MSTAERPIPDIPDLLQLASARMPALVAELKAAAVAEADEQTWGPLPTLVSQVAQFVLAEAIRLIRLGTRVELTSAAVELSEMMITPEVAMLKERHAGAYTVLTAASMALSTSLSPASRGGELTVLRSWNGKALEIVRRVRAAPERQLPRAELRALLGIEESNLSHLLGDLEAAGLIERIRDGRSVAVHLGPRAEAEHVRQLLDEQPVTDETIVADAVERVAKEVRDDVYSPSPDVSRLGELRDLLSGLAERTPTWDARPVATTAAGDLVDCHVLVTAIVSGPDDTPSAYESILVCRTRIENGRIASAQLLWSSDADWLVQPPRRGIVDLGVTRDFADGDLVYSIGESSFEWTLDLGAPQRELSLSHALDELVGPDTPPPPNSELPDRLHTFYAPHRSSLDIVKVQGLALPKLPITEILSGESKS